MIINILSSTMNLNLSVEFRQFTIIAIYAQNLLQLFKYGMRHLSQCELFLIFLKVISFIRKSMSQIQNYIIIMGNYPNF